MYKKALRRLGKIDRAAVADLSACAQRRDAPRGVRSLCCWLLGEIGDGAAVPALVLAYKSLDKVLIWEAGKALAKIGGTRVLATFLAGLRQHSDEERRVVAINGLGLLRSRGAVPALRRVLRDTGESPRVRAEAAEALGYISDRRALPTLLRATYDRSSAIRFWAAFALGLIGGREAVARLKELASSDAARVPGWGTVSQEAADALKQIRMLRAAR